MSDTTTTTAQGSTDAAAAAASGTTTTTATPAPTTQQTTQQAAPKTETKAGSFLDAAQKEAPKEGAKTDGQQASSTAPKDGQPELTIKLPEGVKADEPLVTSFTATAKELGLTGEQAQKIVDSYAKVIADSNQKAQQAWEARLADNRKALEAHPEVGGQNLEKAQADARRFINWLDREEKGLGRELVKTLEEAGLGDSLAVARAFASLGRRQSEDSIGRTSGAAGDLSPDQQLRQQYPSMFNADGTPKI